MYEIRRKRKLERIMRSDDSHRILFDTQKYTEQVRHSIKRLKNMNSKPNKNYYDFVSCYLKFLISDFVNYLD